MLHLLCITFIILFILVCVLCLLVCCAFESLSKSLLCSLNVGLTTHVCKMSLLLTAEKMVAVCHSSSCSISTLDECDCRTACVFIAMIVAN